MNKFYILQKNTFHGETTEVKLPTEMIDQSGCFNLGPEPFTYDTYEEAKKIKGALEMLFDKVPSSITFIIVEEINEPKK